MADWKVLTKWEDGSTTEIEISYDIAKSILFHKEELLEIPSRFWRRVEAALESASEFLKTVK